VSNNEGATGKERSLPIEEHARSISYAYRPREYSTGAFIGRMCDEMCYLCLTHGFGALPLVSLTAASSQLT